MPMPARFATTRGRILPLLVAGVLAGTLGACSTGGNDDESDSIVRTTTMVAGAGVVGLQRDTRTACPAPSAPDAGAAQRQVVHAGGTSTVAADPQRIVVLSTQALDAVCALGLWERVVGAATLDGPVPQPGYLGTGVAKIPSIGTVSAPDPAKIAGLQPDLILGTSVPDRAASEQLGKIAPTVFDGVDGSWQRQFQTAAAALGRTDAGNAALADYRREARDTGIGLTAAQTQASVVRFGPDTLRVLGSDSFAGSVLADAGVRRPPAQQGTSFDVDSDDLSAADGDLIYVMFDGDKGRDHGTSVMGGDAWTALGAAEDHRVFNVEDSIWTGDGLTAARAVLGDLRESLNGYVQG